MELPTDIIAIIEKADNRALATYGRKGINVVPVSVLRVVDGDIWLHNFFMDKTIQNIESESQVALVCWHGFKGVQIKAAVNYETEGSRFMAASDWLKQQSSNKPLRGLLILRPEAVYDVSINTDTAGEKLV